MNDVRGGFTAHDRYRGWRASCRCGWLGPWRGTLLRQVEADALEHLNGTACDLGKHASNSSQSNPRSTTIEPTYTSGPGDVSAPRDRGSDLEV